LYWPACAARASIVELCRREGIAESLYYSWSKEFLEAGKKRFAGDTARQGTAPEVKELRSETSALKEVVAKLTLETGYSKKGRGMRYPASEKLEIIRTVEASHLPGKPHWYPSFSAFKTPFFRHDLTQKSCPEKWDPEQESLT
jgi:hypothetical protein